MARLDWNPPFEWSIFFESRRSSSCNFGTPDGGIELGYSCPAISRTRVTASRSHSEHNASSDRSGRSRLASKRASHYRHHQQHDIAQDSDHNVEKYNILPKRSCDFVRYQTVWSAATPIAPMVSMARYEVSNSKHESLLYQVGYYY